MALFFLITWPPELKIGISLNKVSLITVAHLSQDSGELSRAPGPSCLNFIMNHYIKFLCICVQSVISTNNIQLLTYVEMDIAVLLNSKLHIGEHEVKVNKIKFIVQ